MGALQDLVADTAHFLLAYPNGLIVDDPFDGPGSGWNFDGLVSQNDDIGFTNLLIDHVMEDFKIDPARVHATGWSMGSQVIWTVACKLSDRIASVAGVSGPIDAAFEAACDPGRSYSAMLIHGTADIFWPPGGVEVNGYVFGDPRETTNFWANQNNCGLDPLSEEIRDTAPDDNSTVTLFEYTGCDGEAEVLYYRINDGGHTWPGGSWPGGSWPEFLGPVNRDIHASAEIWDFFVRNPHPSLASGDTEAPECELLGVDPGPPTRLDVRVQDVGSGLASITVVKDKNATVTWEAFALGTRDAVNITATKVDESKGATVALEVTDLAGHTTTCDPVVTTLSADVPEVSSLQQNYPNPFNPQTQIRFSLAEAGAVRLVVYDVTGREVVRLVDEAMERGQYEATWEGRDATGRLLSSGVYLYRLEAGPFTQTKSMVLLK